MKKLECPKPCKVSVVDIYGKGIAEACKNSKEYADAVRLDQLCIAKDLELFGEIAKIIDNEMMEMAEVEKKLAEKEK